MKKKMKQKNLKPYLHLKLLFLKLKNYPSLFTAIKSAVIVKPFSLLSMHGGQNVKHVIISKDQKLTFRLINSPKFWHNSFRRRWITPVRMASSRTPLSALGDGSRRRPGSELSQPPSSSRRGRGSKFV